MEKGVGTDRIGSVEKCSGEGAERLEARGVGVEGGGEGWRGGVVSEELDLPSPPALPEMDSLRVSVPEFGKLPLPAFGELPPIPPTTQSGGLAAACGEE